MHGDDVRTQTRDEFCTAEQYGAASFHLNTSIIRYDTDTVPYYVTSRYHVSCTAYDYDCTVVCSLQYFFFKYRITV